MVTVESIFLDSDNFGVKSQVIPCENMETADKIADKIDDLTHPNETKTEKFMRKTGEFFEKTKNEIKNSCGC